MKQYRGGSRKRSFQNKWPVRDSSMRSERAYSGIPQSGLITSQHLVLFLLVLTPLVNSADRKAKLEKHKLKTDLLNLMKVNENPLVSRSRSEVPKYVIDLYKKQAFGNGFTKDASAAAGRTVRTFFRDDKSKPENQLFEFNVSTIAANENMKYAELRMFKRRSKIDKPHGHFKVTIYRLTRRAGKDNHERWKRKAVIVDAKLVKCRRVGEWLSFNLTSAVAFWAKWPSRNFGLWVSVRGVEQVQESDFDIATGGRKDPILVTFEETKSKKDVEKYREEEADGGQISTRGKKRFRRGSLKDADDRCQKRKLFVRFRDLNWHKWIIAPRGFSAFYCKGSCPEVIDKNYNPTNHAIIQNLLHYRYSRNIPVACCVPTGLHSISMLYFELDGSIVLREYSGMVASTCGCR